MATKNAANWNNILLMRLARGLRRMSKAPAGVADCSAVWLGLGFHAVMLHYAVVRLTK